MTEISVSACPSRPTIREVDYEHWSSIAILSCPADYGGSLCPSSRTFKDSFFALPVTLFRELFYSLEPSRSSAFCVEASHSRNYLSVYIDICTPTPTLMAGPSTLHLKTCTAHPATQLKFTRVPHCTKILSSQSILSSLTTAAWI